MVGGVAGYYAEQDVRSIEAPAQRIAILSEDHVAHIVDQVILPDLNQGGRGMGALDPDLAVQHAGAEVGGGGELVRVGGWIGWQGDSDSGYARI